MTTIDTHSTWHCCYVHRLDLMVDKDRRQGSARPQVIFDVEERAAEPAAVPYRHDDAGEMRFIIALLI